MHGGAKGSGGPWGKRNGNYRHGLWIRKQLEERRKLLAEIREIRTFQNWWIAATRRPY
jgi:hypothetical protein